MDINALKTFLEVAKTRHFGNAADALFVSQSTVSARIRTLENLLGVTLFVRERGNVRLTPSGEALITHAKSMMTLWARAKQEIAVPTGVRETLVFGGLSGLWDITLQDWLYEISQSHPKLAIAADIFGADTLFSRVMDGTIDVAFLYDPPQGVNIASQQLKTIKLRMVSSEPVGNLEENWAEDFIHVDWGLNYAVQFAAEFPELKGSKMTTGLGRIASQHIKRAKGYAYLAEPAVQSSVENGELFYVPDTPVFKRKAYAIYHEENEKASLIQELIERL
ncbi:MAG: DNA-binding transcriptional LysR family regulator [Cryomorphaceae bacterium]|jgi:DNA-binding transcriptional LysR family regulator